ncbi:hypothetical protein SEVIR_8G007200v4 [Setaria viridis]|uniref:FHA domain-containing protein n=1 Tax=Setaria viridis TaxID=4556 RepID=A0A4U6TAE9_SETVI|nr:hypothetical protein SEVIR_8G007200v2 [Setaria viridis]
MRPGVGSCTGQAAASTLISHDPQEELNRKQQNNSFGKQNQGLLPCRPAAPDLMEAAAATTSSLVLFSTTPRRSVTSFLKTSPSLLLRPRCNYSCSISSAKQQHLVCQAVPWLMNSKKSSTLRCTSSLSDGSSTVGSSVRWVLDPAGDGDWRHIGYKVARPGAFEIASDAVTVGRVADKADIVLPVATVSGTHARLEKKDGRLFVTDLDSTNGTYINERRLNPGFPIPIDPGSLIIFGDIHLAMFRVRKMIVEVPSETQGAQQETNTEVVSTAVQDTAS